MSTIPPDVFEMGPTTLRVSRKQIHSGTRRKLQEGMQEALSSDQLGIAVLKGGGPFHIYSTDMEGIFRQESYFHYLFGVEMEDCLGAVDLQTGQSYLFVPRLPDSYAVWMGPLKSLDEYKAKYAVDEVHYTENIARVLSGLNPVRLHLLCGTNSDSSIATQPADFEGIGSLSLDKSDILFNVLTECRVRKTPEELEVIHYANQVASAAHVQVMQQVKPHMMEYAAESVFMYTAYSRGGCRHAPYTPICASGPNGSTLHYGHAASPNDREIGSNDMLLLDMGCEYYCYDSDITCSFPANGKFSEDQAMVYEAVLAAHQAVLQAIKPGVSWPDMHLLAERHILAGLKEGGWLQGEVEDMLEQRIAALFMPHACFHDTEHSAGQAAFENPVALMLHVYALYCHQRVVSLVRSKGQQLRLGHLLGLDTHDVGGYAPGTPPRIDKPGLRSLRTARVLEESMVVTVEPGCYFNPFLLQPAFEDSRQSPFLNKRRLEASLGFGGVRIEDDVIVTSDGARSMTNVPRTIKEIEAVMAGAPWPPQQAAATQSAQPQHQTMAEQQKQAQQQAQSDTTEAQNSNSVEQPATSEKSSVMSDVASAVQGGLQSLGLGKK